MKKTFSILGLSIFFLIAASSCKKENNDAAPSTSQNTTNTNNPSNPAPVALTFTELTAARSSIRVGETTQITAAATGNNLSFNWSCSSGTIVGEGKEVTYGSTCASCVGINTIICTVSDGNSSQTKSIEVTIK